MLPPPSCPGCRSHCHRHNYLPGGDACCPQVILISVHEHCISHLCTCLLSGCVNGPLMCSYPHPPTHPPAHPFTHPPDPSLTEGPAYCSARSLMWDQILLRRLHLLICQVCLYLCHLPQMHIDLHRLTKYHQSAAYQPCASVMIGHIG